MLLSRIFSLMLGTTLFVMIWSMQDGNHDLRFGAEVDAAPSIHQIEIQPESQPAPALTHHPVRVSSVAASSESTLWMFADEPAERVAGK